MHSGCYANGVHPLPCLPLTNMCFPHLNDLITSTFLHVNNRRNSNAELCGANTLTEVVGWVSQSEGGVSRCSRLAEQSLTAVAQPGNSGERLKLVFLWFTHTLSHTQRGPSLRIRCCPVRVSSSTDRVWLIIRFSLLTLLVSSISCVRFMIRLAYMRNIWAYDLRCPLHEVTRVREIYAFYFFCTSAKMRHLKGSVDCEDYMESSSLNSLFYVW